MPPSTVRLPQERTSSSVGCILTKRTDTALPVCIITIEQANIKRRLSSEKSFLQKCLPMRQSSSSAPRQKPKTLSWHSCHSLPRTTHEINCRTTERNIKPKTSSYPLTFCRNTRSTMANWLSATNKFFPHPAQANNFRRNSPSITEWSAK